MDLLSSVLNAAGGGGVEQIAQRFGLDQSQASSAISALIPALSNGLQSNAANPDGLSGLLGALTGGQHQKYIDDPSSLAAPEAVDEGNGILGHILGSKDASRAVAEQASAQTGISSGVLKQMLPVVATMVMGSLSKQSGGQGEASGILGMLTPMLDANNDGSIADDVLGMASKFFGR